MRDEGRGGPRASGGRLVWPEGWAAQLGALGLGRGREAAVDWWVAATWMCQSACVAPGRHTAM